jgi:hypothetical protein
MKGKARGRARGTQPCRYRCNSTVVVYGSGEQILRSRGEIEGGKRGKSERWKWGIRERQRGGRSALCNEGKLGDQGWFRCERSRQGRLEVGDETDMWGPPVSERRERIGYRFGLELAGPCRLGQTRPLSPFHPLFLLLFFLFFFFVF